jgi:hypothetical protein
MAAGQIPPHPPLRKGGTNMQMFLFRYLRHHDLLVQCHTALAEACRERILL